MYELYEPGGTLDGREEVMNDVQRMNQRITRDTLSYSHHIAMKRRLVFIYHTAECKSCQQQEPQNCDTRP